jgi:hypothetical protein
MFLEKNIRFSNVENLCDGFEKKTRSKNDVIPNTREARVRNLLSYSPSRSPRL